MVPSKAREIEESEIKARGLMADIIPLLGKLKDEALDEVSVYLENALKSARKSLETAKTERLLKEER